MLLLLPEHYERLEKEMMKDIAKEEKKPSHGQYRVLHFPQIPCKPFEIWVQTIKDGQATQNLLAQYDLFLLAEKHRDDFSNASCIQVWDEQCSDDEGSCWIDVDDDEQAEIQKFGSYEEYKKSGHTS